ncbi:ORT1 [Candida oxycetoniae]|uniref:Mitochondrial thiamine pyrophosphate carrier 1 n=1 Tax=Candida oxycetoniae TaxID=497107 RepID=A0AAI9WZQ8_9ASCO|nr:ORT1 [Candida oxycetoniae]KAI3406145.2 ORT1 [Candida oxycetoniae]
MEENEIRYHHGDNSIHPVKEITFGAISETAILFSSYNYASMKFAKSLKVTDTDILPLWSKCVAGGFAGFMASFVLTPVELVKCQLQVVNLIGGGGGSTLSHSYTSIIKSTLKNNGISGLWKGLESTMIREVFGTAIWFGTYEYINTHFKSTTSPTIIKNDNIQSLFSGAMAGITFNFCIFPIDTIKSNIQTHDILNNTKDKHLTTGFWQETRKLLSKKGGVLNLYNGLGITMIRCIPANALLFYTYELLKREFS